ncbi:hypothetical protein QJS10_CPB17g00836 [Acorus calamus]|uniref:Cytochrome P450 n=1 Tax=Acorus calamus TaxID=4465 RepID=A0AAV9CW11_ACOCL|nr:hypothetical protein QJS10_CPB17g00836 [Acorus calamus]
MPTNFHTLEELWAAGKHLKHPQDNSVKAKVTQLFVPAVAWALWLARNHFLFRGDTFFYWFGLQPRICITNPDMVKQVLSNKFDFYTKDKPRPAIAALLGKGLVMTNGTDWVRHRRVVSPAFTMDKLKVMTKRMGSCALSMLDSWQDLVMRSVKCEYLPTKWNRHKWEVERKATSTLRRIIQARLDSKESGYGNDLLGLMMESSTNTQGGLALSMDEIISECKTFFFVGHETTANLLTWAMFLLGSNQDWQERLREEVLRECGQRLPMRTHSAS